jgi:hypothetical protein
MVNINSAWSCSAEGRRPVRHARVVITVFIAGLMVGRTPEYLSKKIQAREVRWRCSTAGVSAAISP